MTGIVAVRCDSKKDSWFPQPADPRFSFHIVEHSGHSRMLYPHSVDADSGLFRVFCRRFAIRAAKFGPDTDISFRVARTVRLGLSVPKTRGH
jgi:hypothetical protein